MKLSNVERKSVKPEETQQLSCTGNLEKALPHQFLVLTAQDSSAHRLVSLAICAKIPSLIIRLIRWSSLITMDKEEWYSYKVWCTKSFSIPKYLDKMFIVGMQWWLVEELKYKHLSKSFKGIQAVIIKKCYLLSTLTIQPLFYYIHL